MLRVVVGETALHALAYIATDKRPHLAVYDWYVEHVLVGAAENGLPVDYIETRRRFSTVVDSDRGRVAKERAIYGSADTAATHVDGR
jgi:gamma-glutamylcyclotransferase